MVKPSALRHGVARIHAKVNNTCSNWLRLPGHCPADAPDEVDVDVPRSDAGVLSRSRLAVEIDILRPRAACSGQTPALAGELHPRSRLLHFWDRPSLRSASVRSYAKAIWVGQDD